jgi:hypothetical protein
MAAVVGELQRHLGLPRPISIFCAVLMSMTLILMPLPWFD